ncbi:MULTISPECIES: hypothetical protein [unclassified Microbacterium]
MVFEPTFEEFERKDDKQPDLADEVSAEPLVGGDVQEDDLPPIGE